jgi:AAA+ ATPase superfamily predicted ATPase
MTRAAELHRGLVVIIDEFPYLLDGKDTLTSIIQKFWDSKDAERGNLKIVLCGSLIAHMEILLSERNPLYGRRTFSLGFGRQVYERQIQPHLSEYMGWAFEQICRDHIRLHAQERFDVPASEIGKIWGRDFDIDIAGSLLDQSRIFGECKWENALVGESIHRDPLENISKSKFFTEGRTQNTIYFSRKGFTVGLQKLADTDASIQLIGTDELVKAPAYGWDGPSGP